MEMNEREFMSAVLKALETLDAKATTTQDAVLHIKKDINELKTSVDDLKK
ncbi:hypothetical protein [Paenibacillus swuensis]|nr:hypothetical protein [Paenibacillus swuensis]